MENENIEFDNMQAEADIMPMAIEEQNYYVDFDHLQKYHEKLKGIIPRPTYYKLQGDLMTDTGGVDTDYTVAISNLTPQSPTPIIGDVVIFSTSDNVYIGTVKEKQELAVLVTAKLKIGGTGL